MNIEYPEFDKAEIEFEIAKHLFSDLPKIKSNDGEWGVSKYTKKLMNTLIFLELEMVLILRPNMFHVLTTKTI